MENEKSKFYKLERLLNLLSFKLDHKDYVASFSLIYDLELGDTSKEEMLKIFKKVAHYEHEFNDYKTFELINGGKDEK